MRLPITALTILALIVAACGGDESEATTTTAAATTTSTSSAPTTTEPATTTSGATSTTGSPPSGKAQFTITRVTFGDSAMIVITNAGGTAGNLSGHFLCQRPSYWALPDLEVAAGQSVAIDAGGESFNPPTDALIIDETAAIGGLDAGDGEIGLYTSSDFASPDAIISYVEWGSEGHGRSNVAMSAGIWSGFVETTSDTLDMTALSERPTSADDWAIDQ